MSTLLLPPTLSSDDEGLIIDEDENSDDEDADELDKSFEFGGVLVSALVITFFCLNQFGVHSSNMFAYTG
jgi:hypothetical protein